MAWIWKNLKKNSRVKLLIWEDWQGRQIPVPAENSTVYYNPDRASSITARRPANAPGPA